MALNADEVVRKYTYEIWNEGKVELIRELTANPLIRHDANKVTQLTHDEQIERIKSVVIAMNPIFENVIQSSDGIYVTAVFQCTTKPKAGATDGNAWIDEEAKTAKSGCGIEVFKVVDGRITDVWNCKTMEGLWG